MKLNQCLEGQSEGIKGLTSEQFNVWTQNFEENESVKNHEKHFKMLHEGVFIHQKIERINYEKDLPKDFTPEKYMTVYSTIWKSVRHQIWKKVATVGASLLVTSPEWKALFKSVYEEVHANFETFRKDTYELVTGKKADSKVIKKIMQKSYINFASNPAHSAWTHQINAVATEHGKAVNAMNQFKLYPAGIEVDPTVSAFMDDLEEPTFTEAA